MAMKWVAVAAMLGLMAVAAGAFGAHLLKDKLIAKDLTAFETAARYQMYHALALIATAWIIVHHPTRTANLAAWLFLIGVIFFSGSIYGLVFFKWRWLGPVTPLGGLLLMLGWLMLIIAALSKKLPQNV